MKNATHPKSLDKTLISILQIRQNFTPYAFFHDMYHCAINIKALLNNTSFLKAK